MVEIWLLHLQPFTKSHFHFLTTVELVTSQMVLEQPKCIIYVKCDLSARQCSDSKHTSDASVEIISPGTLESLGC
jgi:hypothetical protein